ncbi:MAG: accessory gene regulator B family protein [Clostridia bacterium]|nr:accessory gene regulator B family protein [Clostridia bacterium]
MVDKFCTYLTNKIRKEMPEVDDERAEVINYGIQLIVGEIPKILLLFVVAFILKIGWLTLFAFFAILPYKKYSGGFHLKTHVGCIIGTCLFYFLTIYVSKYIVFEQTYIKYVTILAIWIFSIIMVKLYAPADTENLPILSEKERKYKKIMSYVTLTITLIVAVIIPNNIMSNILIIGTFLQTISITKIAYRLSKNKYGYEVHTA